MGWAATAAGMAIVLLVLRDIFHTLGHPEGQGALSSLVLTSIWRLSKRRGGTGRFARLAGPLALIAVILVWGMLAVIGWALVYWPWFPDGFTYVTNPSGDHGGPVLDSLYISMVTISTLGFGDIVPTAPWLRIITPLEALFGFALLTVSVSWVLQIYPALNRSRVLAIRLALLRRTDTIAGLRDPQSMMMAPLLEHLANDIIQAKVDLSEYSETYYFRDEDPNSSLAVSLAYAVELGRVGSESANADVQWAAAVLNEALEEFAGVLQERFRYARQSMPDVIAAYASDHGHLL